MTEQPTKTEPAELAKVLSDSKLELTESEEIKQSYLPYFEQLAEIKAEATKINFENPTETDEKIARILRLKLVKIRTGSEEVKDERKRIHMLKANVEQSAWNLIRDTCKLEEETFTRVEKKRELAEKARLEARKQERLNLLAPFEVNAEFVDLLNMPDAQFETYLSQSEAAHKAKIAEALRLEAEEKERQRVAEEKRLQMLEENKRLKAESEAKEKELAEERAKAEQARKEAEAKAAKIQAETERLRKETNDRVAAEQEQMRKEAQAKIDAERKAREKIEAELKAKAEQEAKALADREAAAEAELSKGDAEKFKDFIADLNALKTKYTFKSKKYQTGYTKGIEMLEKMIDYLTR